MLTFDDWPAVAREHFLALLPPSLGYCRCGQPEGSWACFIAHEASVVLETQLLDEALHRFEDDGGNQSQMPIQLTKNRPMTREERDELREFLHEQDDREKLMSHETNSGPERFDFTVALAYLTHGAACRTVRRADWRRHLELEGDRIVEVWPSGTRTFWRPMDIDLTAKDWVRA